MNRNQQVVRILFATGIISVGAVVLVYGYQVLLFQAVPPSWAAWLKPVGWVSGVIMLGTGLGLLFERSARLSTRIVLAFLLLWTLSRLPAVPADPGREISWFAVGEVAVLFAGALVLSTAGLFWLRRRQAFPTQSISRSTVIGSIVFGLGWALSGVCPGAALAQLGEGKLLAAGTVAGIAAGTWIGGKLQARVRGGAVCGQ